MGKDGIDIGVSTIYCSLTAVSNCPLCHNTVELIKP